MAQKLNISYFISLDIWVLDCFFHSFLKPGISAIVTGIMSFAIKCEVELSVPLLLFKLLSYWVIFEKADTTDCCWDLN